MAKPPKRNEMSDMVHRIKTENAKGFPYRRQTVVAQTEDGLPVEVDVSHFGDTRRYNKD